MAEGDMLTREEVLFNIFLGLRIPILAVDLGDLEEFVAHPRAEDGSNYSIRLDVPIEDRRPALIAALRGLISSLEVPRTAVDLFSKSTVFSSTPAQADRLRALVEENEALWTISENNGYLRWDEISPWPAAYRVFLGHFSQLIWGYATQLHSRKKKLGEGPIHAILDQASRVQPTRHHYAAASLGAWLGGATNLQYISFYATDPQCREANRNNEYAERIKYTSGEAKALTRSGMIAVPASLAAPLLNAQGDGTIFGAIPIDEWSAVNLPDLHKVNADRKSLRHPGLLIDKYYRAPFAARPIEHRGLYGRKDVLRDHYEAFYKCHKTSELLRCKHYCAPIIEVSSSEQLSALIRDIPLRGQSMFFRGQTRMYELERDPNVQRLLFGNSTSREPSLVTSAARIGFDYDSLHYALRYFMQDRVLSAAASSAILNSIREAWRDESMKLTSPIDYAIMALAQHYGLPSHGLDVTDDIDAAIWFATNRFTTRDHLSSYKVMDEEDWGADHSKWPVIFACQQVTNSLSLSIQSCTELDRFGLPALRPQRQKASFFLGGHSDHQNRLAEAVVCAFRLAPGDWSTRSSFESLFPAPDIDPAYAAMLEFSELEEFKSLGSGMVARYH